MTNLSEYAQWSPIHKETQDTEIQEKIETKTIIITVCKIAFLFGAAGGWLAMAVQPNMPWLLKAPFLATALLLFDRAVWMVSLTLGKWAVTDAPDAHSFERTSLFLILLVWLMPISYKQFGDGECDSKPDTTVIVEKGKEVTIEVNKNNTLGICDFIQNDATSTLMWALCTVPLLLLFGTGWKTLKATSKQRREETVWLPIVSNLGLLLTAIYCLFKLAKLYWLLITAKLTFWWSHLLLKLWMRKVRKKNQ